MGDRHDKRREEAGDKVKSVLAKSVNSVIAFLLLSANLNGSLLFGKVSVLDGKFHIGIIHNKIFPQTLGIAHDILNKNTAAVEIYCGEFE